MRFRPNPELYPFTSRWLTLADGTRIHHVDEGSGPVSLLLHGNPAWSFLYRKIIPRLSRRFRCIAPDLPGFGLSTARTGYGYTAREQSEAIEAWYADDPATMHPDTAATHGTNVEETHV